MNTNLVVALVLNICSSALEEVGGVLWDLIANNVLSNIIVKPALAT